MKNLISSLKFIYRTKNLWWYTSYSRTQERFSRTFLGSFWLGLSNLISVLILAAIYSRVLDLENFRDYFIYLGLGLTLWGYINLSITGSTTLIENNKIKIKNIKINPLFYIAEEWSFQFQTFVQSFAFIICVLSFVKFKIIFNLLFFSLPALFNLTLFLFWLPLFVCIIGSKFQDIYQLVPVVMQLLFYSSPILYKKEVLGDQSWIIDYNLLFQFISPFRESLITGKFNLNNFISLLIINIIGLIITLKLFNKYSSKIVLTA